MVKNEKERKEFTMPSIDILETSEKDTVLCASGDEVLDWNNNISGETVD